MQKTNIKETVYNNGYERAHPILLAMKKRGFGEGKWNGVDGSEILDMDVSVLSSPAYE
ncbi:MAG: hypothetical protein Q7R54_00560 [bacterium]|nr:hypothetical protein [bacterium]